jgi:hypothetical protein
MLAEDLHALSNRRLLQRTLRSPVLLDEFKKYCALSFCVESVYFLVDVEQYRRLSSPAEQATKARCAPRARRPPPSFSRGPRRSRRPTRSRAQGDV